MAEIEYPSAGYSLLPPGMPEDVAPIIFPLLDSIIPSPIVHQGRYEDGQVSFGYDVTVLTARTAQGDALSDYRQYQSEAGRFAAVGHGDVLGTEGALAPAPDYPALAQPGYPEA